jgi:hypothetical protein
MRLGARPAREGRQRLDSHHHYQVRQLVAGPTPATPPEKTNPKIAPIQKRLAAAKRKLEEAKTTGKTTRPLEDKIYEIEDELRLANQPH